MDKDKFDILLVEDNMDDAELTRRAFTKNNISNSILHLKNGAEALDFMFCEGAYKDRCMGVLPKLVLLDLKMPKVDGLEVLRKLKQNERTKIIPVVILSSSKEEKDIIETYKLGANSFLVKPVEFDGFVHALTNLGRYWLQLNQLPQQL
jgi:two-component system, response regulator